MKYQIAILSAVLSLSVHQANGAVYRALPGNGNVIFLAKGKPALISIQGEGEGLTLQLSEQAGVLNGEISFNLNSLKTGIDLRDEHLKNKYLEISKFPSALLKVKEFKLPEDTQKSFDFTAILNLHGTEQSVSGTAQITKDHATSNLTANFKIKLSQFQIEIPSFQGVTVAEDVSVSVDVPLEKVE